MISDDALRELEKALGPENVSSEPAVMDGYSWQSLMNTDPDIWIPRPVAAVLPSSTQEVQAVIRICNKHGLKYKALSVGWGSFAGPGCKDVIQIDLRRMDRIVEIDERNMYAVVEPFVSGAQLQAEAMQAGLNTHMIGAGAGASPLASATSGWGIGMDGIYMSYSPRNVLGVEWVLPSGEVLRLGALGSTDDWFSGDGPGPSLRGIMRGWMGTFSGLGVFTKCALKLFNWPGPSRQDIQGLLLDVRADIPDNFKSYLCVFPGWDSFADAVYKIGEAEIAYILAKNAIGLFVHLTAPRMAEKTREAHALRSMLKALQHEFAIVLAADSKGELDYQTGALTQIMSENQGVLLDISNWSTLYDMLYLGMIRNSLPPLIFRPQGSFSAGFGVDESFDSQVLAGKLGEDIKQKWIDEDAMLDDMADDAWMAIHEGGMWAHCEEMWMYDPRNRKHTEALLPIALDFVQASLANSMGAGMLGLDPRVRKLISPLQGNYNLWQKKIHEAMDKKEASDTTFYTDEWDLEL
jgi:glycolate oxidase